MAANCRSIIALLSMTAPLLAAPGQGPNVLLVCFDDLRPVLGCYGGQARTPHLDRFAESAVRFDRHYVQFPSCGPSRAALMSGLRADTIGCWGNGGVWVVASDPDRRPTLPLTFRNHGYTTLSFGKTYHGRSTVPGAGWSSPPWQPDGDWTCYVNARNPSARAANRWRPAYEIYDGPDELHSDCQTATEVIRALRQQGDGPFFIAVGFRKPHLPFVAPRRCWDLYDDAKVAFPEPTDPPRDAVLHCYDWSELWSYGDRDGTMFSRERPPSVQQERAMTRAYCAAVSFNDEQFGRLLAELDELGIADTTAVVVWSDHGFHLGDQKRWAKWTQFEADMRAPLLMRLPGAHDGGRVTNALIETVDIYPTLIDFCQLGRPAHLEGTSQLPVIAGKAARVKDTAYSVVRPLGKQHRHLRVYSMRTPNCRYNEWRDASRNNEVVATELYRLGDTLSERENIAETVEAQDLLSQLRAKMPAGFRSLHDPSYSWTKAGK